MSKFKLRIKAIELASRTRDAFSAGSYRSWTAVCEMLLTRYTERQAEAILYSKWTRWARNGIGTVRELEEFLNKQHATDVLDLEKEHFGG